MQTHDQDTAALELPSPSSSMIRMRCESERPSRSSFQTTSTSPGRRSARHAFNPGRSSRAPEARS